MKLIDQSHEILAYPEEACHNIEHIGRTCYKSENRITGLRVDAEKFVKMLRDRKHHAMLEFGVLTVKFITNRGVTHELVRHRLCSFAQESTRYCNYGGKDMEFIRPVWLEEPRIVQHDSCIENQCKSPIQVLFENACDTAEVRYNQLISYGCKPQQAREVLPNALKTEIVVQANLREWRHIFKMRCDPAAHPQMVALMRPLLIEVKKKIPVIYDDLYPEVR